MEAIHIRQRLRPSRHAFIVREGDVGAALQAASLNAALWGGIYNPIVTLEPVEEREGILKEFDPDLLVNLTCAELPGDIASRFEHRVIPASDLIKTRGPRNQRELGFGFNVLPIIRHIYEKEVRFTTGPSRATLLAPDGTGEWPQFVAFAYGSFEWLPQMDLKFEEAFRQGLGAKTVPLPVLTLPPNYQDFLPPIGFTAYGLQLYGDRANFSSHIIYIADHRSLTDLIEFWNIRATGRRVIFVPVAAHQSFEPLIRLVAEGGRYPINEQVQNNADLQKGPSLSETLFTEVCDWIASLSVGVLPRRTWRPRFGMEAEFYVGDIHVSEIEASAGEEISILEGRQMTPVKMISPPYLDERNVRKGHFSWSVEVTMAGGYFNPEFMFWFPNEPFVESAVRRAVIGGPGKVRLSQRGLVLQEDWTRSTLQLMPVSTNDVFQALFQQAGLDAEPSQPGQYADQIIKKMGSLHGECRIFKIRGVRDIVDLLSNGSTLTKGNMYQIVITEDPDQLGQQNWRPELYRDLVLRSGQPHPLRFATIFDVLLEKRVIRPGFAFRCLSCFKEDWYHISEFGEEFTCRFCFKSQRVNFASARDWQYKADGLFQIPASAQGSVAVILSLWRFADLATLAQGRYVPSRNLVAKDTGRRFEIDYAYVTMDAFDTSYELVLGEAKGYMDISDDAVIKMADLADRFPRKPYLAFSTLKDRFSDAEKERLRGLAGRGYKVIALTREELDPYWLYERFEAAPNKHASSLKDLSENTLHLNVG